MFSRKDDVLEALSRIENRLSESTPPPDHPHAETLQCHKRVSDSPCKCRLWMDVIQNGNAVEPSRRVTGCFFELFPWLISGAIVASNGASADVNALRNDVQDGLAVIGNNVAQGFNVLAQRMQLLQSQTLLALEDGRDED